MVIQTKSMSGLPGCILRELSMKQSILPGTSEYSAICIIFRRLRRQRYVLAVGVEGVKGERRRLTCQGLIAPVHIWGVTLNKSGVAE